MRKIGLVLGILIALAASAEAQSPFASAKATADKTADQPRWDLNVSGGLFNGKPGENDTAYDDDWYQSGRVATSIGYYWTENLKTELEFATTSEGSRYIQDYVRFPNGQVYPYSIEKFHRLQQTSLRMAWQFLDNTWVHPYLNGGFVFDVDRTRYHVPEQYYYPGDPRTNQPQLVRSQFNSGKIMDYGGGVSVGGGAKFYVSPKAYINTGMQVTYGHPSSTVSFLAGFGIDF